MMKPFAIDGGAIVICLNELDFVEIWAERLKSDNSLFAQQKRLIDSQIAASRSLFGKMLESSDYKKRARKYLKGVGLI